MSTSIYHTNHFCTSLLTNVHLQSKEIDPVCEHCKQRVSEAGTITQGNLGDVKKRISKWWGKLNRNKDRPSVVAFSVNHLFKAKAKYNSSRCWEAHLELDNFATITGEGSTEFGALMELYKNCLMAEWKANLRQPLRK